MFKNRMSWTVTGGLVGGALGALVCYLLSPERLRALIKDPDTWDRMQELIAIGPEEYDEDEEYDENLGPESKWKSPGLDAAEGLARILDMVQTNESSLINYNTMIRSRVSVAQVDLFCCEDRNGIPGNKVGSWPGHEVFDFVELLRRAQLVPATEDGFQRWRIMEKDSVVAEGVLLWHHFENE